MSGPNEKPTVLLIKNHEFLPLISEARVSFEQSELNQRF